MSDYSRWEEVGYWYDEGGCGPPTQADEDWYYSHVALAQDRAPAVNRQPAPMDNEQLLPGFYEVGGSIRWKDGTTEELPSRMVEIHEGDELDDQGWWAAYDRGKPYPDVRE